MTLNTGTAAVLNSVLIALQVIQASQDELDPMIRIVVSAAVSGIQAFITEAAFKRTASGSICSCNDPSQPKDD